MFHNAVCDCLYRFSLDKELFRKLHIYALWFSCFCGLVGVISWTLYCRAYLDAGTGYKRKRFPLGLWKSPARREHVARGFLPRTLHQELFHIYYPLLHLPLIHGRFWIWSQAFLYNGTLKNCEGKRRRSMALWPFTSTLFCCFNEDCHHL